MSISSSNSTRNFSEFDAGNIILFQIEYVGEKLMELIYLIKITAYSIFPQLRIIK